MDFFVHAYNWITDNIALIGGYAGLGAGIAFVVQTVKVKFKLDERCVRWLKLDGKQLVNILLTILTALPFIVDQVLQELGDGSQLSPNYAWLFVTAVWLHRFAVSPLYGVVKGKLEAEQQKDAKAAAYDRLMQQQATRPIRKAHEAVPTTATAFDPTLTLDR